MTHYYYYITAGNQIDCTSQVYLVAVGTSMQGNRDYLYVLAHATNMGYYFEIRSLETTEFVTRVLNQLRDDAANQLRTAPQLQLIKIRDLVRNIKSYLAQPLSPSALHNAHELRNYIDSSYRAFSNLSRAAGLPSVSRKKPKAK